MRCRVGTSRVPKKTVLITQSNYIPWKGYFDAINRADEFIIYDEMQYTRRDWRNRNKILTPAGLQWLTIPVSVRGKYHQTINETLVSDPGWRVKHWNAIKANYARAPFFNDYRDDLEACYLGDDEVRLSRINEQFISLINKFLKIDTKITRCEGYGMVEGKTSRLVDLCIKAGATNYLTGPAARDYLDGDLFSEAGISIHWLDYDGYPEYPQLHGGFEHGLTVLDLLFNVGSEATEYMKSF
jgi:hypothetical protein